VVAFPTFRAAVDLRRATRGEWVAGLVVCVLLAVVVGVDAGTLSFLGFAAAFVGLLMCILIFAIKCGTGKPGAARATLVVLLGLCAGAAAAGIIARALVGETRDRGDAIAAALKAYSLREGRLPESLDDLVPGDLQEIPTPAFGIFTEGRFGYWPNGGDYRLFFTHGYSRMERTSTTAWRWWD